MKKYIVNYPAEPCKVQPPDAEQLSIDAWYREFFLKYPHLAPKDSFEYNEVIKPMEDKLGIQPKQKGILTYSYRTFWDWLAGNKTAHYQVIE